jgi:hypothetical protein
VVVFGGWLLNVFPRFFFQEDDMVVFPLGVRATGAPVGNGYLDIHRIA